MEFFKESDDPTVIAVLMEDGVAVLGVVLALIGLLLGHITGQNYFDAGISIVISFLMAFLAITLGVVIGTYSSIYVAAPVTLLFERFAGKKEGSATGAKA